MKDDQVLKTILSLPLAVAEGLVDSFPADVRASARRTGARILMTFADVARTYAERAADPPATEEEASGGLHTVPID